MGKPTPWLDYRRAEVLKAAGDAEEAARLIAQMDALEPKVRAAFLEAIKRLQEHIDVDALVRLLRAGDIAAAIASVSAQAIALGVAPVSAAVADGIIDAAKAAAKAIPAPGGLDVTFQVGNPTATRFLAEYQFNLIREMTAEARKVVGDIVRDGVDRGINPLDVARDVRQHIGLTRFQANAVRNYRRLLQTAHGDALNRALRDRRFDASVARAIANQTPLSAAQIDKLVARYEQRYLKYRSEMIARTEALRSVNAGAHLAWSQAVDDGTIEEDRIVRKWVFTHDSKTRPAHRAIPGMNPDGVGLKEPFKTPDGPMLMPGDPKAPARATIACRCTTIIRYQASAEDDRPARRRPGSGAPDPRIGVPQREADFALPPTEPEILTDEPATSVPDEFGFSPIPDADALPWIDEQEFQTPPPPPAALTRKARHDLAVQALNETAMMAKSNIPGRVANMAAKLKGTALEKAITPEQGTVLAWYTGGGYRLLNAVLRRGSVWDTLASEAIGSATANATRIQAEALNGALDGMLEVSRFEGVVKRGYTVMSSSRHIEIYLNAMRDGTEITFPAFTSASTGNGFAGNIGLRIKVKNGVNVAPISLHPSEAEVLLRAGTRFRVLNVEERPGGYLVDLEEVTTMTKRLQDKIKADEDADREADRAAFDAAQMRRREDMSEDEKRWADKMQSGGGAIPA